VYCFARKTHSYLDLDSGLDFDSQIVVKVNAPDLLRRQLGSRRWHGEHIAMGTNVDCYQRAEGGCTQAVEAADQAKSPRHAPRGKCTTGAAPIP
jgi:DNA repair photolyase